MICRPLRNSIFYGLDVEIRPKWTPFKLGSGWGGAAVIRPGFDPYSEDLRMILQDEKSELAKGTYNTKG